MEPMRITSVNVGEAETLRHGTREELSGINKQPIATTIAVTEDGLQDDTICDAEHHGGVDQAVYAYGAADYEWWSNELGREIAPGMFGDNLTIDGLPDDLNCGDRLLISNLILEATAPRIPCSTLASQMEDSDFGMRFRQAEKPGFYFRVLHAGEVSRGESVTLVEGPHDNISMLELFRLSYVIHPDEASLRHALHAPLAARMRDKFEKKLANL